MFEAIMNLISTQIGAIITAVCTLIVFFLGRYTSYRDDQRKGMKELNDCFYRPFLTTYNDAHRAYAYYVSDLPLDVQERLVTLLINYQSSCSPKTSRDIMYFIAMYSGYSEEIKNGEALTSDEQDEIEKTFSRIYTEIDKLCKKNNRKLYCSVSKRIWYRIQECFYWVQYHTERYLKKIGGYLCEKKKFSER